MPRIVLDKVDLDLDAYQDRVAGRQPFHATLGSVSASRVVQRGAAALNRLLEAYEFAAELQRSVWDFALEVEYLRQLGLTNNELRWLVCTGLAKHACEISPVAEEHRAFEPSAGRLTFEPAACFVLTEAGTSFVRNMIRVRPAVQERADDVKLAGEHPAMDSRTPLWDRDRQELRLGYVVVKRFRVPAPNQVMILRAFQEECWPARVDDPLPPRLDVDPKRRLHDTINSLNRSQQNRLVSFRGDGSGCGICWKLA